MSARPGLGSGGAAISAIVAVCVLKGGALEARTTTLPPRTCIITNIPTELVYRAGAIATCDLDGDGVVDSVTVRFQSHGAGSPDRFILTVAGRNIEGRGEDLDSTFAIMDLDRGDRRLEVAIPASGLGYYPSTAFYDLTDGEPSHIGTLPGSRELVADGSGTVRTRVLGQVLCIWSHDEAYRLNAEREFVRLPHSYYSMELKATMLRSLTLPSPPGRWVVLHRGDRVTLIASDDRSWVDIASPSGRVGRLSIDEEGRLGGTRWQAQEIFAGLPFAD